MKRFLSILIALAMLVGIFAMTAVAFAEPTTPSESGDGDDAPAEEARHLTFNVSKFKEYVVAEQGDFYLEMDRSFMFENKWWEDSSKVHEIFDGINYRVQPKENLKDEEGNDKTTKYTVKYDGGEHCAEDYTVPSDGEYVDTQHFKLPTAPSAATHKVEPAEEGGEEENVPYYFAGWRITAEGDAQLPVHLEGLFDAGANIAMPETNITVTAEWTENKEDADNSVKPDDKIYLLYVSPSGSTTEDMKDWSRCLVTSTFSLTTDGEWNFRFAVVDGEAASESGYTFDYDDVIATTFDEAQKIIDEANDAQAVVDDALVKENDCTLTFRTKDTVNPEIKLSTSQENKQNDGLTVGTTYSVSTSLDITDCSGTTVTYIVYKKVGSDVEGADSEGWLQIYDSKSREVAEGYEYTSDGSNPKGCISSGGVITPLQEDVTGEDVYKIVYTVVDNYGNHGVRKVSDGESASTDEYHPTMLLKVNAAPVNPANGVKIEAWKIVLYVIAGLSAVGIIVLLFIKPKQQTSDARYNASASDEGQPSETTNGDSDDKVE